MRMRARASNNDRQHDRMVMDKKRGFEKALLYSYQAAWVRADGSDDWHRALMNPDKVKFDYDEKIISIDFGSGFHAGTTFEWGKDTGSYWIILKTEDTELAYLRGNCRRCNYLTAVDPETHQEFSQWAAIRGPVETKINTIQKAGLVADVPNLSLNIYMRDTDQNRRTFERYKRFEFNGRYWKVQAPDFISTPGILEIVALEDYECRGDEMFVRTEETIVEPVPADQNEIIGDTSVRPLEPHTYSLKFAQEGEWYITLPASKNKEVEDVIEYKVVGDMIKITWIAMLSGSYILHHGDLEKTILVESLF